MWKTDTTALGAFQLQLWQWNDWFSHQSSPGSQPSSTWWSSLCGQVGWGSQLQVWCPGIGFCGGLKHAEPRQSCSPTAPCAHGHGAPQHRPGRQTEGCSRNQRNTMVAVTVNMSFSTSDSLNHALPAVMEPWCVRKLSILYLSQSVSQGFDHDAAVVVSLRLELLTQLLGSKHTHSKHSDVVCHTAVYGGNKIRHTQVGLWTGAVLLHLQHTNTQTFVTISGSIMKATFRSE